MKKLALLFVFVQSLVYAQGEQRYADGTATDQDGNTFEWINYGTQDWAIENAEVVTYRDGTPIPQVTDDTEWANLTTGAWCYQNNDPNKEIMYNWYALKGINDNDPNTPNKEFAPTGWRVPSDAEWTELENFLIANSYNYDGTTTGNKIAKAMASKTGWNSSSSYGSPGNNPSLNNTSGFNARPFGGRWYYGSFENDNTISIFWSSSEEGSENVWLRDLNIEYTNPSELIRTNGSKRSGLFVRFVRDSGSIGAYGNIQLNGTVSAENNQIKNVADPTDAQDAATKAYADAIVASRGLMNFNSWDNYQVWNDNTSVNLTPNSFVFLNADNTTLVLPDNPENCCFGDVIYIYVMRNASSARPTILKSNNLVIRDRNGNQASSGQSLTGIFQGGGGLNMIINVGDYWMAGSFESLGD